MAKSLSVVEAIDNLRGSLEAMGAGNYQYPWIANGPVENVLAFNNDETIKLVVNPTEWHFSSTGLLTDLHHNTIPGSSVQTTFPVDQSKFAGTGLWPPPQPQPFTAPPLDNTNVTGNGYSKQAYFFNGGGDSFVTVGPSLPKISAAKGGGAQFWVGSIGVIAQGTGSFEGVRGVSSYIGSAYLEEWPDDPNAQIEILTAGFKARVGTYVKFVQTP